MSDLQLPSGFRVLVVEDDPLVSMTLEDMLLTLGAEVVGPARTLEEGFGLLEQPEVQLAILDVSLGREPVYPLAEALQDRGVPLIFTTGYDHLQGGERFAKSRILPKPYTTASLAQALQAFVR